MHFNASVWSHSKVAAEVILKTAICQVNLKLIVRYRLLLETPGVGPPTHPVLRTNPSRGTPLPPAGGREVSKQSHQKKPNHPFFIIFDLFLFWGRIRLGV